MMKTQSDHALNGELKVTQRIGRKAKLAVAAAAMAILLTFASGLVTDIQAKPEAAAVPTGSRAGLTPFLGELTLVPYNVVLRGWMPAEGQLLPINQNQALFSLLGARFGGNGVTSFALPNLKGPVANVRYLIAVRGIYPVRD